MTHSTVATSSASIYYGDDFAAGASYSNTMAGSLAWTTNWLENLDGGSPTTGDLRARPTDNNCPTGSTNCARITSVTGHSAYYLYRTADLSACISGTLTYSYNNITTGTGNVLVQMYHGTTVDTLATYSSANLGNSTASYPLTTAELVNGAQICLSEGTAGSSAILVFTLII